MIQNLLNYSCLFYRFLLGWEEYSHFKSDAAFTLKHVNKELLKDTPLNCHVSLFNVGGLTAYAPLMSIGEPKEGETIFISVYKNESFDSYLLLFLSFFLKKKISDNKLSNFIGCCWFYWTTCRSNS